MYFEQQNYELIRPVLKKIVILCFCFCRLSSLASSVDEAFKALSVYDYFKAKKLFYVSLKKDLRDASYGLATIFYRNDNPFSQVDSAAKYIAISRQAAACGKKKLVSRPAIDSLANLVARKGFGQYLDKYSLPLAEKYLSLFYFAPDSLRELAYARRDSLRLLAPRDSQSSDSMLYFMAHYPESVLCQAAGQAYELYLYKELVPHGTRSELEHFIAHYPHSPYRAGAEEKLFGLIKDTHRPGEVYDFIKQYSSGFTSEQAWKYLYSIAVTNYSEKALQSFLEAYPEYPYRQNVQKEIVLSASVLMPLRDSHDHWGYIDTLGNWTIAPQYDDASDFGEGYAPVCVNDSCYYIDKEGRRTSAVVFSETYGYHQGVAVVKQKDHYFLINRSGQFVSQPYDEIGDVSGNLYVVKQHNLYGAINRRGIAVIPAIYNKLGDFRHGFAYYVSGKYYGLVDTLNKTYEARWDWVSDVDTARMAVVKQNNLFGLLRVPNQLVLDVAYDQVRPCGGHIFMVVKNNLYGFYKADEGCFISSPEFDYRPQYEPAYYSNGKLFKRLKGKEVSLADANGRISIDDGRYDDVFFARDEMIRIMRGQKFGYADRKLKVVIAADYDKATDFENGRAVVTKKGTVSLLDKTGKSVLSCKDCNISAFGAYYLVETDDKIGLVDTNGNYMLQPLYESIERLKGPWLVARKAGELYLFNTGSGSLKKL